MTRLLVTGGAGFIGSNLVRLILRETAHDVIVVDKLTYASNPHAVRTVFDDSRVQFVQADIADAVAMARVFRDHRPASILNLAAETHVDRSIDSSWPFVQTNMCGTVVLLEESRRLVRTLSAAERDAFRFLHISTDEVYGSLGPSGFFTETSNYEPNSPYAASKAAADHMVRAFHHTYGLPTLVTNCSNNYGPFQHAEKLIPLMILNALEGRPLPIYGDGKNVRDWLHVEDHCAALMLVLQRGEVGTSYNVGASNEQSNEQLVDQLCSSIEEVVPARSNAAMAAAGISTYRDLKLFVPDRPGHDRRYAVDATRLRTELGWAPRHTFADGLKSTVRWYVEHRDWFAEATVGYNRERLGLGVTA